MGLEKNKKIKALEREWQEKLSTYSEDVQTQININRISGCGENTLQGDKSIPMYWD